MDISGATLDSNTAARRSASYAHPASYPYIRQYEGGALGTARQAFSDPYTVTVNAEYAQFVNDSAGSVSASMASR